MHKEGKHQPGKPQGKVKSVLRNMIDPGFFLSPTTCPPINPTGITKDSCAQPTLFIIGQRTSQRCSASTGAELTAYRVWTSLGGRRRKGSERRREVFIQPRKHPGPIIAGPLAWPKADDYGGFPCDFKQNVCTGYQEFEFHGLQMAREPEV